MVDLCQPFLAFNGGDWETIGHKVSEDTDFPSDHTACSVWAISRHQNRVSHLLIFHRQQAYYSLNSCSCPPSFNDICYFNSTPNSFLFKFSRGRGGEKATISAFYIRILTFRCLTVAGMLCSDFLEVCFFLRV